MTSNKHPHTKKANQESEQDLRTLMEQAPVGIVTVDMAGMVSDINPAALQILGSPNREVTLGLNVLTMPELVASGVNDLFRQVLKNGEAIELEAEYTSRWGKQAYLRTRLAPRYDAQSKQIGVIQILEDITEQKQLKAHLTQQLAYERALAAITRLLLQKPKDEVHQRAILNEALTQLVTGAKVDRAFIFRTFDDPELGECIGLMAEACAPGIHAYIDNEINQRLPVAELLPAFITEALKEGKPVGGATAELWVELPEIRDALLNQSLLSTQFFPIMIDGRWWGHVGFDDTKRVRQWSDEELVLLQAVADIFGSALQRWEAERALQAERDALEGRVQERTARLQRRLQLERVLAAAARLMARDDFGTAMLQTLQEVGETLEASQVLLVRVDTEKRQVMETYRWRAPDIPEWPLASGSAADWFRKQLSMQEPFYITRTTSHFQPGHPIRKHLLARDIQAMAMYPLTVDGNIAGIFNVSFQRPLAGQAGPDIRDMLDIMASLLNGLLQRQILIERRDQQILEQTRALSAMLEAAMLDADARELSDVIRPILTLIAQLSQAQNLAVYEQESDGRFRKIADLNTVPGIAWAPEFQPSARISHWLEERSEPLLLNPNGLDEMTPFQRDLQQPGVGMLVDTRAWRHLDGLLLCYRPGEEQYSPNQVAMTMALADYMSTIIENYLLRRLAENTAIIEERQRLARDLHDSVSQSLYGVMLFARAGRDALESGEQDALGFDLTRVEENALRAMKEMRLLLFQLQPHSLEQGGLAAVLQDRFLQVEDRLGVETILQVDPDIGLPQHLEETFYRLASEALNNVLKHADATRVEVNLAQEDGDVILAVTDNGRGFDLEQSATAGMGLKNMRFRTETAGGQFYIDSAPGRGTIIRCLIPLAPPPSNR